MQCCNLDNLDSLSLEVGNDSVEVGHTLLQTIVCLAALAPPLTV